MSKKGRKLLHVVSWIAFIIYLILMVYFLFFCEQLGRTPSDRYHYNLKPFTEIKRYMGHVEEIGYFGVALNLFGNVVCFMPLGFVLPILSHRKWGVIRITIVSFLSSCVIEVVQLVTKLGSCDVDDIILNTLGGLTGYILFVVCSKIYRATIRNCK
ncbi:MAG: VanZ family protein [Lachnospiraceae bacterium]|jgi:Glycopeptide antibiotics resistance protein|nr:VanZ family protein [Lachnospiraceae bacterium]MCI8779267.1 VanZ family protein [Lachnospiraceae bacterium]